jgi:hypothetical protein
MSAMLRFGNSSEKSLIRIVIPQMETVVAEFIRADRCATLATAAISGGRSECETMYSFFRIGIAQ